MSNRKRIRRLTVSAQEQDARFFAQHPGQHGYTRPATRAEREALDYPAGTRVYVALLGTNKRARAFIPPTDGRRN